MSIFKKFQGQSSQEKVFLTQIILALIIFTTCFFSLASYLPLSFWEVMKQFFTHFYIPDKNEFKVAAIEQVNPLTHLYAVFLISFIIQLAVNRFYLKLNIYRFQNVKKVIMALSMVLLGYVIVFQSVSHYLNFRQEFALYDQKSTSEKIELRFKNSYNFAQYCQSYLKGPHYCQPLTDLNSSKAQDLRTYFAVKYYLYPIDIALSKNEDKNCLVIFLKKGWLNEVPSDFQAMVPFDSYSLLAIRKMQLK